MDNFKKNIELAVEKYGVPLRSCQEEIICGSLSKFYTELSLSLEQSNIPEIKHMHLFQWIQSVNGSSTKRYSEAFALVLDLDENTNIESFHFNPAEDENSVLKKFPEAYFQNAISLFTSVVTDEIKLSDVSGKDFVDLYGYFKTLRENRREVSTDGYTNESGLLVDESGINEASVVEESCFNIVVKSEGEYYPLSLHKKVKDLFSDTSWEALELSHSLMISDLYPLMIENAIKDKNLGVNRKADFKDPFYSFDYIPMKSYKSGFMRSSLFTNSSSSGQSIGEIYSCDDFFWQNISSLPSEQLRQNLHIYVEKAMKVEPGIKDRERQHFLEDIWNSSEALKVNKSVLAQLITLKLNPSNKYLLDGILLDVSQSLPLNPIDVVWDEKALKGGAWKITVDMVALTFNSALESKNKSWLDVGTMMLSEKTGADRRTFVSEMKKTTGSLNVYFDEVFQSTVGKSLFLNSVIGDGGQMNNGDITFSFVLKDPKNVNSNYNFNDECFFNKSEIKEIVKDFFDLGYSLAKSNYIETARFDLVSANKDVFLESEDFFSKKTKKRLLDFNLELQNKDNGVDEPGVTFKL